MTGGCLSKAGSKGHRGTERNPERAEKLTGHLGPPLRYDLFGFLRPAGGVKQAA